MTDLVILLLPPEPVELFRDDNGHYVSYKHHVSASRSELAQAEKEADKLEHWFNELSL